RSSFTLPHPPPSSTLPLHDALPIYMGDAPTLVLAVNRAPSRRVAEAMLGNVLPGMWSFMLAARARGLGTAWTSMHLTREREVAEDRKSTRLNSSHDQISYAVFCLKK